MITLYHASNNPNISEIQESNNDGKWNFGGLFADALLSRVSDGFYGDYIYEIVVEGKFASDSDIKDFFYTEESREWLESQLNKSLSFAEFDMASEIVINSVNNFAGNFEGWKLLAKDEDDAQWESQRLRAAISKKLGFAAYAEEDGDIVLTGKIKLIGHKDSEEVKNIIEETW